MKTSFSVAGFVTDVIFGCLVLGALAACARKDPNYTIEIGSQVCTQVPGENNLYLCRVPNGPDRVVYKEYKKGGISCDWSGGRDQK